MYQRAFGIAVLVITINELIENGKTGFEPLPNPPIRPPLGERVGY